MINDIIIGKRIRELREKKGISQEELGKVLERTHAAVSDIERGKTKLAATDLSILANYFGVSTNDILRDEAVNSPVFTQYRDSKDMTPDELDKANKVAQDFIKFARELAEKTQK